MKHSFSRRKKIFLSVTAGVVLVVFLAGAAGAAYISGKMDLLSRPSAGQGGSSQSGTDPGDAVLSFDGMDLSGIDVMENGGSIAQSRQTDAALMSSCKRRVRSGAHISPSQQKFARNQTA